MVNPALIGGRMCVCGRIVRIVLTPAVGNGCEYMPLNVGPNWAKIKIHGPKTLRRTGNATQRMSVNRGEDVVLCTDCYDLYWLKYR